MSGPAPLAISALVLSTEAPAHSRLLVGECLVDEGMTVLNVDADAFNA